MSDLLTQLIECNQWRFIGRLGADPEIKYLPTGQTVANGRLLVNRPGQKRDDGQKPYSFRLAVWGEQAQGFADAARKGDLMDVEGRVKTETWTDRNTGEERRGVVLTVESFEVLARPGQGQQAAAPVPAPQSRPATPTSPPVWGSSAGGDSDAPF